MKTIAVVVGLISACWLTLATDPASAQASRTWVSGVGDDANPCSRTAPCKTFAGAISKTAAGGEIDALDPGGFGTVTITKAITIDGGGGQVASVLAGGVPGIVVQAGANDVVILRNLRINGISSGTNGIRFTGGKALHVQHCHIFGFTQKGIDVEPGASAQVTVQDTTVANNGGGIFVGGGGAGIALVSLNRVQMNQNATFGLRVDGTAGLGANVSAWESHAGNNGADGFVAASGPAAVTLMLHRAASVNNGTNGAQSNQSGGASSLIMVAYSNFEGNMTGVLSVGGGSLCTYQNNSVNGNGTNGTFNCTLAPE